MSRPNFSRWTVQSAFGVILVGVISMGFSALSPSAQQPSAQPAAQAGGSCQEGFSGSPDKGCTDVNECASANGGCHKLVACVNAPGTRSCGTCPKDFKGDGDVGCFDVNECPNGDCTGRIPTDAETTPPPVVTTSGDVAVAALSEAGGPATFTVSAKDGKDGTRPAYCLPRTGSTFTLGQTTVSCWATNSRGKIGRATLTVTVTRPTF